MEIRNTGAAIAVSTIRMVMATINSTSVKPLLRKARGVADGGQNAADSGTLALSAAPTRLEKLRCTTLFLVLPRIDSTTRRPCSFISGVGDGWRTPSGVHNRRRFLDRALAP